MSDFSNLAKWRLIKKIFLPPHPVFAGVCSILISLVLPETYVPYLLYQEAKRLRKETGDERYHSALEDSSANESPKEVLRRTVGKPFIMIVQEPMLAVITLLMSFVYGIVYLLFEAIVRQISRVVVRFGD